jgi:hypothetical protein
MGDENTIVETAEFYGRKVIPHMLLEQRLSKNRKNDEYADFAKDLWPSCKDKKTETERLPGRRDLLH